MLKKIWQKICFVVSSIAEILDILMYIGAALSLFTAIFGPSLVQALTFMFVIVPLAVLNWLYELIRSLF